MSDPRQVLKEIVDTIGNLSKRVRKLEAISKSSTMYVVNVRHYGALGDGVTDDSAAIQRAINSVGADTYYCNLHLYFPPGTYLVGTSIDLTDKRNILIEGSGGGIDGYGTSKILGRTNGKPILDMSGCTYATIRDITIYGDSSGSPSCGILEARSTTAVSEHSAFNYFERVDVDGYYTVCALYSWSAEVNTYSKCSFRNYSTSGKCAAFIGGRNRYAITSDYITFSSTVSSLVGRFSNCFFSLYNATSPDAVLVLGDSIGNFIFDGGYAQCNLVCPTVEIQGSNTDTEFKEWYVEHNGSTIGFYFTLYDGGGTALHFRINAGQGGDIVSTYYIDQVANHTLDGLYIDRIRSRGSTTSDMRFQGTVNHSIIRRWWVFDSGSISFNVLLNSEVWYHGHTITTTTELNNRLVCVNAFNDPSYWFADTDLRIGTTAQMANGDVARLQSMLYFTATWDPGSLADGASETKLVSVSEIFQSDFKWFALATLSTLPSSNWNISAHPYGNGVAVTITNHTGGSADLGQGELHIIVWKVA